MSLDARLQSVWYGPAWRSLPLWPLSLLFRVVVWLRASLRRAGVLPTLHAAVPVVVVGNLTVGGTGKTPVAAWLAHQLQLRGLRVGVVLRGYGGSHRGAPRVVDGTDAAAETGDEAVLHARRGVHVVVIGADRVAAARLAQAQWRGGDRLRRRPAAHATGPRLRDCRHRWRARPGQWLGAARGALARTPCATRLSPCGGRHRP